MTSCLIMLLTKVKNLLPANAWVTNDNTPIVTHDGDYLIFNG